MEAGRTGSLAHWERLALQQGCQRDSETTRQTAADASCITTLPHQPRSSRSSSQAHWPSTPPVSSLSRVSSPPLLIRSWVAMGNGGCVGLFTFPRPRPHPQVTGLSGQPTSMELFVLSCLRPRCDVRRLWRLPDERDHGVIGLSWPRRRQKKRQRVAAPTGRLVRRLACPTARWKDQVCLAPTWIASVGKRDPTCAPPALLWPSRFPALVKLLIRVRKY